MLPYTDQDVQKLSALIAKGDETAFKQLYRLLLPQLASAGTKMLRSQEAVSEVIQECLIRLWKNREKLQDVQYPKAWIFRIFSNECLRYLKKNGLQHVPLDNITESELQVSQYSAERDCSVHETRQLIYNAVTTLSPRQREIYTLSRERGLKIPEIAAELGVTSKYVKKTLIVALQSIRQRLLKAGISILLLIISFFY